MIDVLVAGGGPAGLATAIHAALAGLETVVVEPRAVPVDKACGEGLMPTGVAALAGLGIDPKIALPESRPFLGIRYVDGRHGVQAEFRDGTGLGVRRTALHAALALRAREAGVRVVSGRVAGVRAGDDAVHARVPPSGGVPDGLDLRARWLVAADGLHSPIRASLGLDLPAGGPRRYGLRRHYRVAPWTDFVEVHWAPGGEAYVTPVGDDLVGVAVLSGERRGYHEHLAAFPDLLARLDGPPATPVRGAGPLRQRVSRRVAGRVLLVGDAAGYVDALTGEGLSLALLSARALVGCLRAGRPEEYEAAWRRLSRRSRLLTATLLEARRHPPAARMIVPAARRLPVLFRAAVRSLA
ncbi:NAD(P)/FAD-dependent oxidoreductase [Microbispora cellulosiformans]|uniref:NAD(P)/FAD-dependent oxidoreductase n=1 Tax=Microbispora cellulosiformans TaxID=2614688 RepID=A0A5J5JZT1_9ACTN|nr:NAD(P)/FAD-dependent oxidoreductase [Microbispora cellulosiformans]KAA9377483.1 NAD(P)/FAD-dependent oxidoreductase [Microbispora cellulosiformans]